MLDELDAEPLVASPLSRPVASQAAARSTSTLSVGSFSVTKAMSSEVPPGAGGNAEPRVASAAGASAQTFFYEQLFRYVHNRRNLLVFILPCQANPASSQVVLLPDLCVAGRNR